MTQPEPAQTQKSATLRATMTLKVWPEGVVTTPFLSVPPDCVPLCSGSAPDGSHAFVYSLSKSCDAPHTWLKRFCSQLNGVLVQLSPGST